MSWTNNSETQSSGMFIIGEINEPEFPSTTYTKPKYLTFTVLGVVIYLCGVVLYLYSATLMSFYTLRAEFWNFGFSSLALALCCVYVAKLVLNNLGYGSFKNSFDAYRYKPFFGKEVAVKKTKIYVLTVQYLDLFMGLLKNRPYAVMSTYDATYRIPIHRFQHQEAMLNYFSEISMLLRDDYYAVFQKAEVTHPSLIYRIWQQTSGKFGLSITVIYLFFAAWGLFSMMLYPSNQLYAKSFFLKNPEVSFSFLPTYDTRTIIYLPPSRQFIFGTDFFGRDVFARLVYGTVQAFGVSVISATIYCVLVVLMGLSAAMMGGWWDEAISRVGDMFITFPPVILVMIVATFVGGVRLSFLELYYYYIFGVMALLTWPQGAKLLRLEARTILNKDYILAAQRSGGGSWYVLSKHILPKLVPTIVLLFIYTVTEVIIGMTMIGIIGLGSAALTWGSDIERVIVFTDIPLKQHWWNLVIPSVWVAMVIIGLTLLSDSIRDQFQLTTNTIRRLEE